MTDLGNCVCENVKVSSLMKSRFLFFFGPLQSYYCSALFKLRLNRNIHHLKCLFVERLFYLSFLCLQSFT